MKQKITKRISPLIQKVFVLLFLTTSSFLANDAMAQKRDTCATGVFNFTVGSSGEVVFQASTTGGTVTKYLWDFGDGVKSDNGATVTHQYGAKGEYKVCLTLISFYYKDNNKIECSSTWCKTIVVKEIKTDPCDGFKPEFVLNTSGNNVKVEGKSNQKGTQYYWDFGDNSYAKGPGFKYEYKKPGVYTVCVTAVWKDCKKKICKKVEIKSPCERFEAGFKFIQSGNSFIFGANSNQRGATYYWDYGDGSYGKGDLQKHEYKKPGTYTVCLYAVKGNCKTKVCKTVKVAGDPCEGKIKGNFTFKIQGNKVIFTGEAEGYNFDYGWSYGDGTEGKGKVSEHTYEKPGEYQVCFWISKGNCRTKVCKTIKIGEKDPCEGFNPDFEWGESGGRQWFEGSINDNYTSYTWDFGGKKTGTGRFVYQELEPGTYKVCVKVIRESCTTIVCKNIEIKGTDPCENFRPDWGYSLNELSIVLEGTINNSTVTYSWDFGDSTNGQGRYTAHTYKTGGLRKICATIIDGQCTAKVCKEVEVKIKTDPCKDFIADFSYTVNGKTVALEGVNLGSGTSYYWLYGNGSSGSGRTSTVTYSKDSTYEICFKAINGTCTSYVCKKVEIKAKSNPCDTVTANFSWQSAGSSNPTKMYFSGSSNTKGGTYIWDFGDNTTGTGQSAYRIYANYGTYRVTLTYIVGSCTITVYKTVDLVKKQPNGGGNNGGGNSLDAMINQNFSIDLYPNPSNKGMIYLSVPSGKINKAEIYDFNGKLLQSHQIEGFIHEINVQELPKGNYFLRATDLHGKSQSLKLMLN